MSTAELPEPPERPILTVDGAAALRTLVTSLVATEIVLVVVDFLFAYLDLVPIKVVQHLANLAREDGVGTWFGATQATAVGAALFVIGWLERRAGRRPAGWWAIGGLFVYIGLDDALGMHEKLGGVVRQLTGSRLFDLVPSYTWQVVFVPLFGVAALFMLAFLWRRLTTHLRQLLVAALACFVVAVAMDFVEGVDGAFEAIADGIGVRDYTVSHASKVTEELLEMLGTTAFLTLFATRMLQGLSEWRIAVTLVDGTAPPG